jgi:TPR repeat protein
MMKRAFAVVMYRLALHFACVVHAQGTVPEPGLARYLHLMAAKQFPDAFDLVISAAGAGAPWAKAEIEKLSGYVLYPKRHRVDTTSPDYVEAMAALMPRLQRAVEEGNADAQYILGMKALLADPPNRALGIGLLSKAADQNHYYAITVLKMLDAFGAPDVTSK